MSRTNPGTSRAVPAARKGTPAPERKPSGFANLLLHPHPRVVPAEALRFSRTFGLGGASVVLFVLLAATGALLLVTYEPSPERAYGAVTAAIEEAHFGAFVRNAHYWAANGLVLVTFLQLLRVFYRGVKVDTARRLERSRFEPAQVTYL